MDGGEDAIGGANRVYAIYLIPASLAITSLRHLTPQSQSSPRNGQRGSPLFSNPSRLSVDILLK